MTEKRTYVFNIDPVQQQRPRASSFGRGRKIRMYDPKKTSSYKKQLAYMAMAINKENSWQLLECALKVKITFVRPMLRSFSKKRQEEAENQLILPTKKPDLSNYIKSTEDGLNGIIWTDDSLICKLETIKIFGREPKVILEVEKMNSKKY